MGGKTKQSQRTKNNVRPSSSGRSAELLNNSLKIDSFATVGSGQVIPVTFPTLASANVDQGLTAEYLVCFKKFNKKDPVTKTKALQELTELVRTGNVEDAVAALPSWAHYYQTLTIDVDRRVREATQACHGALLVACGRRIAPHLKRLLPVWLLAQHDEHAPASSLAQLHLKNTFPESKFPEALSFCKSEIISLLVDNLTGNAEAMLSKKVEDPDEKELQVVRVLSSSLHASELFIKNLPKAHDDWLWENLEPLLQASAFWKLPTHTSQHVRSAWYGSMGRTIERFGSGARMSPELGKRAARALVAAPERSATVAAQRWAAVLLLVHNVKDWHTWLDKKDLLIKRLLDVLENAGWGEARLLLSMLLPLLANLPPDLLTKDFYCNFFNAIFTGLDNKTLLSSKTERQTWISNLEECLRFLSVQQHDFTIEVVTYVHRTWLERILSGNEGPAKNNLIVYSVVKMASLIKFWLKHSKEEGEKYDQIIRNFWQNLCSTTLTQIDKLSVQQDDITHLINSHILLLKTLKTAFSDGPKKQHTIKFEDQKVEDAIETVNNEVLQECDIAMKERYEHNLDGLIEKLICSYFDFAYKKQMSQTVFTLLIDLLTEFDSKKIVLALTNYFKRDTVFSFYDNVLKAWLAGDTMRCKALAEIVFLTLKYMAEEEQHATFDTFQQFPPLVVEWCMVLALSEPYCSLDASKRWMRGPVVEASVLALCRRPKDTSQKLLLACVAHDNDGERIIGENALVKVIDTVYNKLEESTDADVESRVALAVALGDMLCHSAHRNQLTIVLSLLRVILLEFRKDRLPFVLVTQAYRAMSYTLAMLTSEEYEQFVQKLAIDLCDYFIQVTDELLIPHIEDATKFCTRIFGYHDRSDMNIFIFTKKMFQLLDNKQPKMPLEVFALTCDCIQGNITCPLVEENEFIRKVVHFSDGMIYKEMTKNDFMLFAHKSLFRAFYMKDIITTVIVTTSEKQNVNEQLDWVVLAFREVLGQVLYEFVIIKTLYDRYAFWPDYNIVCETKEKVEYIIACIVQRLPEETVKTFSKYLSEIAAARGYYWSFAKKYFDIIIDGREKIPVSPIEEHIECPLILDRTHEESKCLDTEYQTSGDQNTSDVCGIINRLHIKVGPKSQDRVDSIGESELQKVSQELKEQVVSKDDVANNKEEDNKEEQVETRQWTEYLGLPSLQQVLTGSGFFHSLQVVTMGSSDKDSMMHMRYLVMMRSVICAHKCDPELVRRMLDHMVEVKQRFSPDPVIAAYFMQENVMLCERNLFDAPWTQIMSNTAIIDFMVEMIPLRWWEMPLRQWDFVTITLCSLVASLRLSYENWERACVAAVARAVAKLLACVNTTIEQVHGEAERRELPDNVLALPAEWDDIFAPDINRHLFELILIVLRSSDKPVTASGVATIGSLIAATKHMDWEQLPAPLRRGDLSLQNIVATATKTLQDMTHHAYKYLAYYTLKLVALPLVLEDTTNLADWSKLESGSPRPEVSLAYFDEAMQSLQNLIDAALSNVRLGEETCEIVPFTDSHCVSLGYLLLSLAMLDHCSHARGDLTHLYVELFREKRYANCLMSSTLRLLPGEVAAFGYGTCAMPQQYLHCFTSPPELDVYAPCDGGMVSKLACATLTETLGGAAGAGARGWCGAADARVASMLRRLLPAAVSPELLRRHLRTLKDRAHELPNAQVSIQWSRAEVQCVLELEERKLELTVRFAPEHPLVPPQITTPPHSPTPDTSWIVMYLTYQNGTLFNALKLWIRAVNARVTSSPQCYICYSRMHHADGRLPSVACHQCKNKYHSQCLRKWFVTSGKSNCPLCRTHF